MKKYNFLSIAFLAISVIISTFNAYSMQNLNKLIKKGQGIEIKKYIKSEQFVLLNTGLIVDFLAELKTDKLDIFLDLINSLKIELIPELINKDFEKLKDHIDIKKLSKAIIDLIKDLKKAYSKNSNPEIKKSAIIRAIRSHSITINESIINKKKFERYINLEQSIKFFTDFLLDYQNFNYNNCIENAIRFEDAEKDFYLPNNLLKACLKNPTNAHQKTEFENNRTNLIYILSEGYNNPAHFYKLKYTFITFAILMTVWLSSNTFNYDITKISLPITLSLIFFTYFINSNIETESCSFETILAITAYNFYKQINDNDSDDDKENKVEEIDDNDEEIKEIINKLLKENNNIKNDDLTKSKKEFLEKVKKDNGKEEEK